METKELADAPEARPARRLGVAAPLTVGLGLVAVLGAALGAPLVFTGPRWSFGVLPTPTAAVQTPPAAAIPTGTPPAAQSGSRPDLTWLLIVLICLAVAAIVFVVVRYVLHRLKDRTVRGPSSLGDDALEVLPEEPSVETSAPYLRRGLRRALALLDGDRSPSNAIIEAWLGLQEAAEDAGYTRLDSETPTEFTSRILERTGVDGTALATLRRLYLAVRFGDLVATDGDVADARAALQTLDAQWAAVAPTADGEVGR